MTTRLFTLAEVEHAAQTVHAVLPPTPQYAWPLLAERTGCEVWLKHENHTPAGAFKIRGGCLWRRAHQAAARRAHLKSRMQL